ncbi:MAG: lipocalin-like domain-containing protein [Candidatus Methylomirabilales bacterium]
MSGRKRWPFTPLALLLVALCGAAAPPPFQQALPGYRFQFPRDHAAHDAFRTEWWYYTGHLRTARGEGFGFQVTFFRVGIAEARMSPSRWAARNLYLAHLALSDPARRRHRLAERVGREALGQAGALTDRYRVWIGEWEATAEGEVHRVRAAAEAFGLDLTLTPEKPPVVHGQDGISRKGAGEGHASHYYSLTRLRVAGVLTLDGRRFPVTGLAWMDHEFGSTELAPEQVGWDWFSVQLEDGTDLMLYLIRHRDGRPDPFSSGTLVASDGTARTLALAEFAVKPLGRWQSPRSGGIYPMGWEIRVPGAALTLTLRPLFPDQELDTARSTQVTYWEGAVRVTGERAGQAVRGQGYVEMTGYAAPFRKKI